MDNGGCSEKCDIDDTGVVCSCEDGGELKTDQQTCGMYQLRCQFMYMYYLCGITYLARIPSSRPMIFFQLITSPDIPVCSKFNVKYGWPLK